MKYIYKSLEFSQHNLGLLILFIGINMITTPIMFYEEASKDRGGSIILISLLANLISVFLLSGTCSLIWKKYNNQAESFLSIIDESKKYFNNYIGLFIAIFIVGLLVAIVITIVVSITLAVGSNDTVNISQPPYLAESKYIFIIYTYIFMIIYCYSAPYLYVKELNSKKAFISAPKIFAKYLKHSVPIIILLLINMILWISISINEVFSFTDALTEMLSLYISFHIFVVTCQILDQIDISEFENASTQNRKII